MDLNVFTYTGGAQTLQTRTTNIKAVVGNFGVDIKVVCNRFLVYVSLLLHSSSHVTHCSQGKIPQYTPIIKSEEEQKKF